MQHRLVGATNIGSADYSALTMRTVVIVCADVCSAQTSRRYQFSAPTIPNCKGTVNFLFW